MEHYFTDNHQTLTNRKELSFRFLDIDYILTTADGIFSKDAVDQGSQLLMKEVINDQAAGPVLDYGCGYGVIGVVMAKYGYEVTAVDITSKAVALTKINAEQNQVDIEIVKIDNDLSEYKDKYASVILNPPIRTGKVNVYHMFRNSYQSLVANGSLYIVIRKQHGAASAIKELTTYFGEVLISNKSDGYWVIKAIK